MDMLISLLKRFWKEESGLTVLEYVVGAAVLAAVIGTVFYAWGDTLTAALDAIELSPAAP